MNFIVYKTTNLINNKFYVGVHKNNNRNYIGSGKLLKQAIKKYGRENFKRETLKEFSSEQDAYGYEKELVNEEMINNPLCYNLVEGGGNPPTFKGKDHPMYGTTLSTDTKKKISASLSGINHPNYGKHLSSTTREKIKIKNTGKRHSLETRVKQRNAKLGIPSWNKGKNTSHETCLKLSNSHKKRIWCIEGMEFYSSKEAGESLGVPSSTIRHWCSNNTKRSKDDCYSILKEII